MAMEGAVLARARTDALDRLIDAEEPLAGLHCRCGGQLPGTVAVPELLEAVRKARKLGLRLARSIEAIDGDETVRAWVEIVPEDGEGCSISVGAWSTRPTQQHSAQDAVERRIVIDRAVAEFSARLDPLQRVLAAESSARDLADFTRLVRERPGVAWTEFVELPELPHRQPLHWRLLDGARCAVPGSPRGWTATLVPLGQPEPGSAGFELLLVADTPLPTHAADPAELPSVAPVFSRQLTPVLRQPITRIIANAETIRSRLAGPIADEYSGYAADIASAGQHLLALIEDLCDLEAVEADDFRTAPDRIDLADVARRAAGILRVRALERQMVIEPPGLDARLPAIGEFRRVLQILLNLLGNSISYAPEGSEITLFGGHTGRRSWVTVADSGPGIESDKLSSIFDKFERLGRAGDGGSGLGLYISRKLARAMGGDLTVQSSPGEGARFTLELPTVD